MQHLSNGRADGKPEMDITMAELERELHRADLFGLSVSVDQAAVELSDETGRADRRVIRRAKVSPSDVDHLVADSDDPGLLIAETVNEQAKAMLRAAGWSYWDRRGDLALDVPELRLRIRVPTTAYAAGADGPDPMRPIAGVGGLSVAVASLLSPDDPPGVREIARASGMAASTISRARRHLVEASLLEPDGRPLLPELFWAASEAWVVDWWPIDVEPEGEGWLLAADAAAAEWGAPTLGVDHRWYGNDAAAVVRLRIEHSSSPEAAACVIAVPPTPVVGAFASGRLVPPVVAALDLSRDARGRQILEEWTEVSGPGPGTMVWR